MKPVVWMIGAVALLWIVATAGWGARMGAEVACGAIAPLLMAGGMRVLMARTYRRSPGQLTTVMVVAFAGKLVFFGAYVVLMLLVLRLRPVPFVLSFICSLVVTYVVEAMHLRRLFAAGTASR